MDFDKYAPTDVRQGKNNGRKIVPKTGTLMANLLYLSSDGAHGECPRFFDGLLLRAMLAASREDFAKLASVYPEHAACIEANNASQMKSKGLRP
jgi:hypothetical protein